MLRENHQGVEQLDGEPSHSGDIGLGTHMVLLVFSILPSYKSHAKALEVVVSDKVIEIDTEAFKSDTQVIPKVEMISHPDIIVLVIRILYEQTYYSMSPTRTMSSSSFVPYPLYQILQSFDFH